MLTRLPSRFYALAFGDLVTKIGDYVYRIAMPLFLLEQTGSALWAGASFAVQQVGTILAGALSGPVIDSRSPRKVMILAVAGMAVLTAALPLLASTASLALPAALLIGFLLEVLNFTYRACLNSMTPMLVKRELLPDASAALSVSKFVSKTAGPALAGVLIATIGTTMSLYVDAASFMVLLVIVAALRFDDGHTLSKKSTQLHLFRDIGDGTRYIFRDRSLTMLNVINFLANLGYVPLLSMLVIHLTGTVGLSAGVVGLIYAVDGLAALLSGLLVPWIMRTTPTGIVIAVSCAGLGVAISVLAFLTNPIAIGVAFFFALGCAQIVNRVIFTHWQMTVNPDYLARVFGLSSALESLATPLAALTAGIVVATVSSSGLLGVSGVLVVLAGCLGMLSPAVRRLDSRDRENDPQTHLQGVK